MVLSGAVGGALALKEVFALMCGQIWKTIENHLLTLTTNTFFSGTLYKKLPNKTKCTGCGQLEIAKALQP